MKKTLLLMLAAMLSVLSFAQDATQTTVTWVASQAGFTDTGDVTNFSIASDLTAVADKNTGNNAPKYYANGESLRLYAGNTLTISGKDITKIEFTFSGDKKELTPNTGAIASDAWTGNSSEIVFTVPTGQARIAKMVITYGGTGESTQPELPEEAVDVVTPPANMQTEAWTLGGILYYGNNNHMTLNEQVNIGFDGNDAYLQGLCYYLPEAWVKGTLSSDGKKISFNLPQCFGKYENYEQTYTFYFAFNIYDEDNNIDEYPETVTLDYDAEQGVITFPDTYLLLTKADAVLDWSGVVSYAADITLTKGEPEELPEPEEVTLPEGVTAEEYSFSGYENYYEKELSFPVFVGFDGNDVYFKGLSQDVPNAWVKGTLDNGKVTIAGGQYFGIYYSIFGEMELYTADAEFTYDAEAGKFTAETFKTAIIEGNEAYEWDDFSNITIVKVPEVAGTPATPSVEDAKYSEDYGYYISLNIPTESTDGKQLLTSKLSYKLFADKSGTVEPYVFKPSDYIYLDAETTEIPYTFTDDWDFGLYGSTIYLYGEIESWTRIGVQTVYTGGGETHESAIGWYDFDPVALDIRKVDEAAQTVVYYDMQGRRVENPAGGLFIKQVRTADGKVFTSKIARK